MQIHYSCFSADGAYVYAAGYDGDVFVSEVATGKILATTKAHEVAVSLVFPLLLFLRSLLAQLSCLSLQLTFTYQLKRVVSSSVGHRIATGSVDKTIKLWDSSTPELKEVAHLKGHTDNVCSTVSLLCFVMFCYVLLCFVMFCYVLLCFV